MSPVEFLPKQFLISIFRCCLVFVRLEEYFRLIPSNRELFVSKMQFLFYHLWIIVPPRSFVLLDFFLFAMTGLFSWWICIVLFCCRKVEMRVVNLSVWFDNSYMFWYILSQIIDKQHSTKKSHIWSIKVRAIS